jgi:SAM-dependent methyltransferase
VTRRTFDAYRESYAEAVDAATRFTGKNAEFFTRAKAELLLEIAAQHFGSLASTTVLDVGCGVGATDRILLPHVGAIHGVDVSEGMVVAASRLNPKADYLVYDGLNLPFPDRSFDLAFAVCVLHHVPPQDRQALMRDLGRVIRPGGLVVVFEHNPLNPFTRRIVANCEFDEEAILLRQREVSALIALAGGTAIGGRYILVAPWRGNLIRRLERLIGRAPLGAQYYVAGTIGLDRSTRAP